MMRRMTPAEIARMTKIPGTTHAADAEMDAAAFRAKCRNAAKETRTARFARVRRYRAAGGTINTTAAYRRMVAKYRRSHIMATR